MSSPDSRRPGSSHPDRATDNAGDTQQSPASSSRASVPLALPPSASRASFSQVDLSADHPARLQMIVALVLGIVLVAIPLYLWRRPRAESIPADVVADAGAAGELAASSTAVPALAPAPESRLVLSEPKNLLCQDPGPKKTPADQCDHVVFVEKALAKAIEETASCVPQERGGTIQYVVDVSFKHKAVSVAVPRDGRTVKSAKVVSSCHSAVKAKLQGLSLEPIAHAHTRYKIAITATYPGASK